MPKQFSTEAANADRIGEDTPAEGAPEGMPRDIGADGTPRDRSDRGAQREDRGGAQEAGEGEATSGRGDAKPGKDINAAGFVKDKDAAKP